ncbi:MAG: hypothetical protein QOH81_1719 [Sphingomonadales bacterium]|jgi:hypothetical protein|nr:hypothetical protein [Sphingomonadales bacterium]
MPTAYLTTELVDGIDPPAQGEIWFADNHLKYFGIRAWAGKKGGSTAYAIRLRDQFGILVRETFRPDRDYPYFPWERAWDKPLGHFLEAARFWAGDRIALHRGEPTSADLRDRAWRRRKMKILATTIGNAIERRLRELSRRSSDHPYLDNIRILVGDHIPQAVLDAMFRNVPVRQLADAVSNRAISYGNVKVLRAFVGAVFKQAAGEFGPLHWKLESIQRRCARHLDLRKAPPYPPILQITAADLRAVLSSTGSRPLLAASSGNPTLLRYRSQTAAGSTCSMVGHCRWNLVPICAESAKTLV